MNQELSMFDALMEAKPMTPADSASLECQAPLEADDSLAVEAAAAEFLEHFAYVTRLDNRVNARCDRAIRELRRALADFGQADPCA
jgi:hypothetical protein